MNHDPSQSLGSHDGSLAHASLKTSATCSVLRSADGHATCVKLPCAGPPRGLRLLTSWNAGTRGMYAAIAPPNPRPASPRESVAGVRKSKLRVTCTPSSDGASKYLYAVWTGMPSALSQPSCAASASDS